MSNINFKTRRRKLIAEIERLRDLADIAQANAIAYKALYERYRPWHHKLAVWIAKRWKIRKARKAALAAKETESK